MNRQASIETALHSLTPLAAKEYRDMHWTPDDVPLDTDLLACFKCTGQTRVPREEVAAAVAAESSTGTWSTVWSELLTDLESLIVAPATACAVCRRRRRTASL